MSGFHVLSERDGYVFHQEFDENLQVCGDEPSLKRVIYNLVSNAVNYTGDDKDVWVSIKAHDGKARFEVTDTGKGIPEEQRKIIWERYYKAHETHKRAIVGTGLGLAIVKNVLDLHYAEYGVISEVGKGSTFWFEISSV